MPIYAYRCSACGYAKDVLQKMSDPVLTVCPQCGASAFEKQVTAAGFQLKGSGWYVTDFRGGDAGKPKKAGDGDAAKPAGNAPAATSGETAAAPASGGTDAAKPAAAPSPAPAPGPAPAAGSK